MIPTLSPGLHTTGFIRLRAERPLTDEELRRVAPSAFAAEAHASRSGRYAYIPTSEVLAGLRREGFGVFEAMQATTRDAARREHTRHLLRLRHPDSATLTELGDSRAEIVLLNSHDGTSAYRMMAGLFRLVCCNGLTVGETVDEVKVPHKGDVADKVVAGAWQILGQFEAVAAQRARMVDTRLDPDEETLLAGAALDLRWEGRPAPISEHKALRPSREADAAPTVWHAFNRLQENLLRGGQRGRTPSGRATTTRAVTGLGQATALNRALWTLADGMARLKRGETVAARETVGLPA